MNPTPEADVEGTAVEPTTALGRLSAALSARFGDTVQALPAVAGEVAIEVTQANWRTVCTALRDAPELCFEQLIDLSGIDYLHYGLAEWMTEAATRSGFSRGGNRFVGLGNAAPGESAQPARFAVVIHLLSVTHNWRLRVQCACLGEDMPLADSLGVRAVRAATPAQCANLRTARTANAHQRPAALTSHHPARTR